MGPDLCNVGAELAAELTLNAMAGICSAVQATMVSNTWTPCPPDNGAVTSLSRAPSNGSVMPPRWGGSMTAGGRRSSPDHVGGGRCPFRIARRPVQRRRPSSGNQW